MKATNKRCNRKFGLGLKATTSVLCLGLPAVASAQDVSPAAQAGPGTSEAQDQQRQASQQGLGDIIVTAQKRTENIQDVPISVVAVSAKGLTAAGVTDFTDLPQAVNGLQITNSSSYVFPIVRGIGSFLQGSTAASSVAMYVDGVYIPALQSADMQLGNVESVQVLKGPQSVLYGRNATGGAIVITTKTPGADDALNGMISASLGNYAYKNVNAYIASGLGGGFAISATGFYSRHSGYVKNLASSNIDSGTLNPGPAPDLDLNSLDTFGGQVKLVYAPTADTRITLAVNGSKADDTSGSGATQLNPDVIRAALQLPPVIAFATEYGTAYGWNNSRHLSEVGAVLTATHKTGNVNLTSISAWHKTSARQATDAIGASIPTFGFGSKQASEYWSQELRANSEGNKAFNWLLGASYLDLGSAPDWELYTYVNQAPLPPQRASYKNRSAAVFGEVYINATDRLTLTAGLRYTQDRFRMTAIERDLAPDGTTVRKRDNYITWRGVLDYQIDVGMIYASVSTGQKAGGGNVPNVASGNFEPEKLTAYEIGFKTDLLDRRLRLNGAAFYYDFRDIQAQLVGGPTGGATFVVNGNKAKASGVELEATALVAEGLTLNGAFTYLFDREYTDFNVPATPTAGIPSLNVTGNKMVGAPEFTAIAGLKYEQDLGDSGTVEFNTNFSYRSGYFLTIANNLGTGGKNREKGIPLLNANIEYRTPNQSFGLSLWVRNLVDAEYYLGGLDALGGATLIGTAGDPRTFGATATFNF
jgi:Outer membrane receptor proteins, mostly Fe transport